MKQTEWYRPNLRQQIRHILSKFSFVAYFFLSSSRYLPAFLPYQIRKYMRTRSPLDLQQYEQGDYHTPQIKIDLIPFGPLDLIKLCSSTLVLAFSRPRYEIYPHNLLVFFRTWFMPLNMVSPVQQGSPFLWTCQEKWKSTVLELFVPFIFLKLLLLVPSLRSQ